MAQNFELHSLFDLLCIYLLIFFSKQEVVNPNWEIRIDMYIGIIYFISILLYTCSFNKIPF